MTVNFTKGHIFIEVILDVTWWLNVMELKGPLCYVLDFDDIYEYAYQTAQKVKASGWRPDVVIGIARGGWVHARIACDLLGIKELYSVKVDHWGVTATKDGKAKLTCPLTVDVTGKKVLVVDDITDTGESLTMAAEHVRQCGPAEVKSATLMHIAGSKFTPDYFGVEVAWAWEIWPWNFYEDLSALIVKIFEGEKVTELSTMELKKHLREYNNVVLADEALSKIKAHMGFLGKIEYPLDKEWKLKT
ncbi:phosphoribosyltransferase [Candidatus Thorarchaeota archaeon]|nr:MAG: phosphoribosyltransferase [Candidatus Thorarchaeota archaeon]